jgi:two-component system NtrC family sensor kinase
VTTEPQPSHAVLPAVLIVDDVEANLTVLRALLDGVPCSVTAASSGDQALRQLLRGEFAVMLLDVQMPGMDGYEVAHHARSNPATRDVPIIFLTAMNDSPENVARGYGSGAVDFLLKPFDSRVLVSKVRVFLELYQARRKVADANQDLRAANEQLQTAYRELQATQAQLVQSAKMASLGELVAGVAHEINNPLAFVQSHLETIRRSLSQFRLDVPALALPPSAENQWQRAQSRLAEVDVGLTRIRDLVLKLRTFSRLDEGERKIVSFAECLDSVLTILGHRLGDRVAVVRDSCSTDMLDCYPALLNQVLMNLIGNGIDAIEGKGTITIRTESDGDRFVISVIDTGCGIPRELRERVLEPFFTTKAVGAGTGLGLSIAYSIVKKHGGELSLTEAEGGGTAATIRLPLHGPVD